MNSTYFKFSSEFYKQKFGNPMGSVISLILAEIVMEDLEELLVFENLEFDFPFYFLQTVIDSFNSVHTRMQFTAEKETNNITVF